METQDSIDQKKREILSLVEQGFSIRRAATTAGLEPHQVYGWKKADPRFAAELADAYAQGGDYYEDQLHDLAGDGNVKAVELGIRLRRPEALREQHEVLVKPRVDEADLSKLSDAELAKLIEEHEAARRALPSGFTEAEYVEEGDHESSD